MVSRVVRTESSREREVLGGGAVIVPLTGPPPHANSPFSGLFRLSVILTLKLDPHELLNQNSSVIYVGIPYLTFNLSVNLTLFLEISQNNWLS